MKGFYIFEESINQLRKEATVACFKLGDVSHIFNTKLEPNAMVSAEVEITASVGNTITKATTNKDVTYDFETGALIALMKMCGLEKVVRACNEAFPKERYNTYIAKFEGELCELKKEYDKVKDLKEYYKKNYEDVKEHYDKLGDRNKYLIDDINKKLEYIKEKDEEIKKLKSDKDKSWKNYQRNIQKKQDRINELERAYKASNDDEAKLVEYYQREIKKFEEENEKLKGNIDELFESDKYSKSLVGKLSFEKHRLEEENEKLQHEYNLCLNSENALKCTVEFLNKSVDKLSHSIDGYKNDLYNTAKRCKELEEENEKLKLDCEKLRHGYIDTDMIFCGGRQNGKQFTFLVDLFKKIDQKKVDAAYKEAYDKRHREFKKKTELSGTFKIDHGFMITGWDPEKDFVSQMDKILGFCKPFTKREEMWGKILGDHKYGESLGVKVERAFINDFLSEAEGNGLVWVNGGEKPTEWVKWESWRRHDYIVFGVWYRGKTKELTWGYPSDEKSINYLPPMRWDLFEKGRIVIKVEKENYGEFCSRMFAHFDKVGVHAFNHDCKFGYFAFNKDTDSVERVLSSDCGQIKDINRRKIVDWEDVR